MLGGKGLLIILSSVVALYVELAMGLGAVKVLRPTQNHFDIKWRAEDCFIQRRVYHKSRLRDLEIRQRKLAALENLQKFRSELEKCGSVGTTLDESVLAEFCPAAYQSWLDSEIKMEIAEEDELQNNQDREGVGELIGENCPRLPVRAATP